MLSLSVNDLLHAEIVNKDV